MQPDFSHLYRALDVTPDCSLDEFRIAYRRYVGQRHPDRVDALFAPGRNDLPLSEATVLHELAVRFHLRHGRLPGSSTPRHPDDAAGVDSGAGAPPGTRQTVRTIADAVTDDAAAARSALRPRGRRERHWRVALLCTVVAAGALALALSRAPVAPKAGATTTSGDAQTLAGIAPGPVQLELGMSRNTVLRIQGEPVHRHEGDWDYGPSWLRFDEHGRLVDWYSSPLSRLQTADSSPLQDSATPAPP